MPPRKKDKESHPDYLLYKDFVSSYQLVPNRQNATDFRKMLFDVRFVASLREDALYSDTLNKVANFLETARRNVFSAYRLLQPSKGEDFSLNVRRLKDDDFTFDLEEIYSNLMVFIQACEKRHESHGRGLKKSSLTEWAADIVEKYWNNHFENGKRLDKQKRAFTQKILDYCEIGGRNQKSGKKSAVLRVGKVKKSRKYSPSK